MIPLLIVVGLIAGSLLGYRRPERLALVGVMGSSLFGLRVGVDAGSAATFAGGAALAAVNFTVGAVVGLAIHKLFRIALPQEAKSC